MPFATGRGVSVPTVRYPMVIEHEALAGIHAKPEEIAWVEKQTAETMKGRIELIQHFLR